MLEVCHSFLVFLALALVVPASAARGQSWVPVGIPGGNVRALAADPRDPEKVYLGTAVGNLYRSDDGGQSWRLLSPGFPQRGCSLDNIVVDPRGVVLVGYWEVRGKGGGIARSADGGQTFVLLKGVQGESVRALAMAPSNPKVIAAGTLTGIFLSRDGGTSWARITPVDHPDLRNIESLAFDPKNPKVIYAGTWHLAWKTLNAGGAWVPVHRGMIDDSDVMTLTTDARDPETIYATACSGIYRSTEGAVDWKKLSGIPYSSRRTRAFAQGINDPSLLLAGTTQGLWISEDGGGDWALATPKDLVVNTLVAQPGGGILLGTDGAGVLRSTDRGHTWVASNIGFSEQFVFKLLFDPAGGRLVAAVMGDPHYGGVFVTRGVGEPWVRLGRLGGRQVLSLALLDDTILAGTDDGIFKRDPESDVWARVVTRLGSRDVHRRITELVVLPSKTLVAATPDGVIRSSNGGQTWTEPTLGTSDEVAALAVSPDNPALLLAATKSGCFRSNDGGETWTRTSPWGVTPHALAFDPSNDRVVFATTSGGLYRSPDQGATWRRVNGGIPHSDLMGIAIHPDGRTLYVSDFNWGGVFQSLDGGTTWARMPIASGPSASTRPRPSDFWPRRQPAVSISWGRRPFPRGKRKGVPEAKANASCRSCGSPLLQPFWPWAHGRATRDQDVRGCRH